jgi:hypothetical protein
LSAAPTSPCLGACPALAEEKLARFEALIEWAQAVHRRLEVASGCDCETLEVRGLSTTVRADRATPSAGRSDAT